MNHSPRSISLNVCDVYWGGAGDSGIAGNWGRVGTVGVRERTMGGRGDVA